MKKNLVFYKKAYFEKPYAAIRAVYRSMGAVKGCISIEGLLSVMALVAATEDPIKGVGQKRFFFETEVKKWSIFYGLRGP